MLFRSDNISPLIAAGRTTFPSMLHPFGCRITAKRQNLTDAHSKAHGKSGVFLGVDIKHGKKAVMIYHPDDQSVTTAVDYIVDETLFPARCFDQRWHPDVTEQFQQRVSSDHKSLPQLAYKAPRNDTSSAGLLPEDAGIAGDRADMKNNAPRSAVEIGRAHV